MATAVVHICDRCLRETRNLSANTPSRWARLKQEGGASSGNEKAPPADMLLCPSCVDECAERIPATSVSK